MTFLAQNGAVHMLGQHAPVRLSEASVDQLLDVFESEGASDVFNALYAAAQEAYGADFIPRTSCLRLVVNNDPKQTVREQLIASCELIGSSRGLPNNLCGAPKSAAPNHGADL